MRTRRPPLEEGGPKRLQVSWRSQYQERWASVDGVQVGQSLGKEALRQGEYWRLPDGSRLGVRLHEGGLRLLLIERDGRPVPGSQGHPMTWVWSAAWLLVLACFVHLLRDYVLLYVRPAGLGAERVVLPFLLSGAIGLSGLVTLRLPRLGLSAAALLLPLKAFAAAVRLTEKGFQFGPADVVLWSLVFLYPVLAALYMLKRAPTVSGPSR